MLLMRAEEILAQTVCSYVEIGRSLQTLSIESAYPSVLRAAQIALLCFVAFARPAWSLEFLHTFGIEQDKIDEAIQEGNPAPTLSNFPVFDMPESADAENDDSAGRIRSMSTTDVIAGGSDALL